MPFQDPPHTCFKSLFLLSELERPSFIPNAFEIQTHFKESQNLNTDICRYQSGLKMALGMLDVIDQLGMLDVIDISFGIV